MNDIKPYAESCAQNQTAILSILKPVFQQTKSVLEIGSGTGQHAVYFAKNLPDLNWQTSDISEYHIGIKAWIKDAELTNVATPIELDVSCSDWPATNIYDGVFSANTVHIMNWNNVKDLFTGIGKLLSVAGKFCLYGPFNYEGNYTSESNARFDQWLKNRNSESGIKDFETLDKLATAARLRLTDDFEMPANNRILVWKKIAQ